MNAKALLNTEQHLQNFITQITCTIIKIVHKNLKELMYTT